MSARPHRRSACHRQATAAIADAPHSDRSRDLVAKTPPSSPQASFMPLSVSARYAALVAHGEIRHDSMQEALALRLDRLAGRVGSHRLARKSSALGWMFANHEKKSEPIK